MVFSRQGSRIFFRSALIICNAVLIGMLIGFYNVYLTGVVLFLVLIFQIGEFVHFNNKLERKIGLLLSSVHRKDYTVRFNDRLGDNRLNNEMNALLAAFQKAKIEKEQQYQYLLRVMDMLTTGILSYGEDGKIHILNRSMREILKLPAFSQWEQIEKKIPQFADFAKNIQNGVSRITEIHIGGSLLKLNLTKERIIIGSEDHHIITCTNISDAVEQSELQAYHKLIKLLTHEILNSVSPMISISETLLNLEKSDDPDVRADLNQGLQTLYESSLGIKRFTDNYRELLNLPKLTFKEVQLSEFVNPVIGLFAEECRRRGVLQETALPENLSIKADAEKIKQVLINLYKNSLEALEGKAAGFIKIEAKRTGSKVVLSIIDNGHGIPANKLGKIFMPFYTTKANGNGIGLSLAKNILDLHNASLRVSSNEYATKFTLIFMGVDR